MCLSACFRRSEPPQDDFKKAFKSLHLTKEVCNRTINTALAKEILEGDCAATGKDLYLLRPGKIEDQLILDHFYLDNKRHRHQFKQHRIQVTLKKGVPYVNDTPAKTFIDKLNEGFEPAPLLQETIDKILRTTQKKLKHHKHPNPHYSSEEMYAVIKKHTAYVNALDHEDYENMLIETMNRKAFLIWEPPLKNSPVTLRRVPSTLKIGVNASFKDFMLAYFNGTTIVHHEFHISNTGHVIDGVWGYIFPYFDTNNLDQKEEAFLPSLFPKLTPFTE